MSAHPKGAQEVERARQVAEDYRARSMSYVTSGGIVVARDGRWWPMEPGSRRNRGRES